MLYGLQKARGAFHSRIYKVCHGITEVVMVWTGRMDDIFERVDLHRLW